MNNNEIIIQTGNLTKKYGKHNAINNVSINLYRGDIYGLIGKNGAGKTTLFKTLMGLTRPTSGEVKIFNNESHNNSTNNYLKNIGFMMGSSFYPYLNARENLEYFCKLKGIKDKKEIDRVLKLVELYDIKKTYKQFSMGMKQRLAIANSLLGSPSIIILDEPTNGLDPEGIADFRQIVQKLNVESNITFIISSHLLSELSLIANRFGFINNGNLIQEIDKETLNVNTKSSLIVKTDNHQKAIRLIEEKLNISNYKINTNNEIAILDDFSDSDKISELLVTNGIRLFELKKQNISLEEYFLKLIGGV